MGAIDLTIDLEDAENSIAAYCGVIPALEASSMRETLRFCAPRSWHYIG